MGCCSLLVRNTQAHQGQYPTASLLLQRGSATRTDAHRCRWTQVDTLTYTCAESYEYCHMHYLLLKQVMKQYIKAM